MKKLFFTFSILVGSLPLWAQFMPDFGPVFPQDEVTVIIITIDPDSLAEMIDNLENEHEYSATFIFQSSELNDTIEHIGLRLRGNTSLESAKKSFKIAFDAFDDHGDWQSLEKMNLLAQTNDPSLLRSKLCHDAFRYFGVNASRTSFTRLYINDEYRGLYLNVEHIDEEFAKKYFDGQGDGNLYKCTYPATLEYLGATPSLYQFEMWGNRPYELKTNNWSDNYYDLAHFIDILNNTSIAELPCELPLVFNVESYLKTAAMDVLVGNWDNYIYNKNNYYLYHDQRTGLINYMPYDLDNTFGIDWVGQDWTERNIYSWAPSGEDRPLFKRLLQVPQYRDRFSEYIEAFCAAYFNSTNITNIAQGWQCLISDAAQEDTYRELDFGFTYDDFLDAISTTSSLATHVDYGISEYVSNRKNNALSQLEDYEGSTSVVEWIQNEILVDDNTDQVTIDAFIEGPEGSACDLLLSDDNVSWINAGSAFADNGAFGDIAGDNVYSYFALNTPSMDKLYYKTSCDEGEFPCEAKFLWTTPSSNALVINEVMASNASIVADENGEFDDWLELYNSGTTTINLTGKFLTDDLHNWNKYPLPSVGMTPGSFRVIWLDNDMNDGQYHANFQIGSDEQELWLIALEEGVPRIVDHFFPVDLITDSSSERTIDGGDVIAVTNTPTCGYSNVIIGIDELVADHGSAYPNPASDQIAFAKRVQLAQLLDGAGRVIASSNNSMLMNTKDIAPGIYFLKLDNTISVHIIVH